MRTPGLSITRIWVILVILTIVSVLIGERHMVGTASSVIVVVLAAIKARWIVLDYMEARDAPSPWRWMYEGWLAACTGLMLLIAIFT